MAATGVAADGGTAVADSIRASGPAGAPKGFARLGRDGILVMLGLPGLLALLAFHYFPLLGNVIAFQDYQPYLGFSGSPWVGVQNFAIIVNGDPEFLSALGNTLVLTLIQTVFVFPVPLFLALLLNSLISERWKRSIQSILYLPHFLSWVIVVALFQQMLGNAGILNTFLIQQDLPTVNIVGVPELFKAYITTQAIWKDAGWGTIIFLAAVSRVDPNLYESAAVDGAGGMSRLWHITLPSLKGLIILLLILRLGSSLTVGFEQIILQQAPVGRGVSEVLDTYVYNNGILGGSWGVATAVGLAKGVVGVLLVLGANRLAHLFGEPGVYQR